MRNLIFFSLILVSSTVSAQQGRFRLTGTIPADSLDGQYVVLLKPGLYTEESQPLDSAVIRNGTFVLEGTMDEPVMAHLRLYRTFALDVILEPGDIIACTEYSSNGKWLHTVSGTPLNESFNKTVLIPENAYKRASIPDSLFVQRMEKMMSREWTNVEEKEYQDLMPMQLYSEFTEGQMAFIEEHIDYPGVVKVPLSAHYRTYARESENFPELPLVSRMEAILNRLQEKDREHIVTAYNEDRRRMEEYASTHDFSKFGIKDVFSKGVEPGDKYTDMKGEAPEGGDILLSRVIAQGKLVLLDFWASWCGPCLKEMPFMISLHEKYSPHGLQVIGLSTDDKRSAWHAAMEKLELPWPQIRIYKEAGEQYGIISIPHTILIGPDGTIIERSLKGEKLEGKIRELLDL